MQSQVKKKKKENKLTCFYLTYIWSVCTLMKLRWKIQFIYYPILCTVLDHWYHKLLNICWLACLCCVIACSTLAFHVHCL